MRNKFIILIIFVFLFSFIAILHAEEDSIPRLLCEIGLKFYKQGRLDDALQEFKKALIVNPNYKPAITYIKIIEDRLAALNKPAAGEIKLQPPVIKSKITKSQLIDEALRAPAQEEKPITEIQKTTPAIITTTPKQITAKVIEEPAQIPESKIITVQPQAQVEEKVIIAQPQEQETPVFSSGAMKEAAELFEIQKEVIQQRQLVKEEVAAPLPELTEITGTTPIPEKEAYLTETLTLDEAIKNIKQPLELEQGKGITLQLKNLQKFLVTYPDVLIVAKTTTGDLAISGQEVGYSSLVIWDGSGRNVLDFLVISPKPKGPLFTDILRKEIEREESFRLRYSMNWASYETGKRLNKLRRQTYSYLHNLSLNGPTPYGSLDSFITYDKLRTSTNLTYATVGLTNGQLGPFRGFSLRGLDFTPDFSNLVFVPPSLRGVTFASPAFNSRLNYILFWGREGGGKYGALSPGLQKIQNKFESGMNLSYKPTKEQAYDVSVIHGWGRDRPQDLHAYGYDASAKYFFDKWNMGYEIAYDTQSTGQLVNYKLKLPRGNFGFEFRDINKKFVTMTGLGSRAGELGGLFNLDYSLTDKLSITDWFNIFKDRLYPSLEDPNRMNFDNDFSLDYRIDDSSSLRLDDSLANELGRLSEFRFNSGGIVYNKSFNLIKPINTYIGFRNQEAQYMTNRMQDYKDRKGIAGLNFSIIDGLNFYVNKEYNWLQQTYVSDKSNPNVLEAGINWSGQIPNTHFYGIWNVTYRDEEDSTSPVSLLSGQDYLDNFMQMSYRPDNDTELYCSGRLRDNWAEREGATKGFEVEFNAGLRLAWNTGVKWEGVGAIEAYVFKDLNLDGLRQRDEPPIQGAKIYLGKNKYETTDIFGYCKFKHVRGKAAYVSLDNQSIPKGYVLTTPLGQSVPILNGRVSTVNFGMASHTEVAGVIFVDANNSGKFDGGEKTVANVVLVLENGKAAKTDNYGYYSFVNIAAGKHTITLQLDSLPFEYLPKNPIKKEIVVYEGITYNYDIPLKEVSE